MSEREAELRRRIASNEDIHDTVCWFLEAIGAQAWADGGPRPDLSWFEQESLKLQILAPTTSQPGHDPQRIHPPIHPPIIPPPRIPPPRIRAVSGATVPEQHADRVVAEMLRWIVAER
jgi:hypothetical protein